MSALEAAKWSSLLQPLSETRALSPTCPQVPVPAGDKVQGRVQDPRILQSAAKCLLLKAPQASGQHSYFIGAGNSPRAGLGPDTLPPPQDAELLMRQTRFFLPSSPLATHKGLGAEHRPGQCFWNRLVALREWAACRLVFAFFLSSILSRECSCPIST